MTLTTDPHAAPAPAPAAAVCPECGGEVVQPKRGRARTFCQKNGDGCKQAFRNRLAVRGKAAVALAQAWRIDRGTGATAKEAFRQFVALLDEFNAEDREAGRGRADVYARSLLSQGDVRDRRNLHLVCTKRYQGCERKHRAPYACDTMATARRAARADGWDTTPGSEACPNCREDVVLERRA